MPKERDRSERFRPEKKNAKEAITTNTAESLTPLIHHRRMKRSYRQMVTMDHGRVHKALLRDELLLLVLLQLHVMMPVWKGASTQCCGGRMDCGLDEAWSLGGVDDVALRSRMHLHCGRGRCWGEG